jgi:DNA/RNA endonuclease YhcR with UshA esterase domain
LTTLNHFNLKNFIIGLAATTVAILLILYAAKVWLVDKTPSGHSSDTGSITLGNSSPEKQSSKAISWQDADKHYGENVTIEGTIAGTYNSGKVCFLNFDTNYRNSFTAVIFASDFHLFPANPQDYYYGKKVRIKGHIKEYNGRPEIILNDPGQVEVIK